MNVSTSVLPSADRYTEPGSGWIALICIALGQLMLALDATIMNVALPTLEAALDFSDAVRPWLVSAYLLPFAALLLPGGRVADALGQKRAFIIAALGFAAASALGGAAMHWRMLVLARALQGTFAALLAPSALSLVAVCFREPRDRARAFGVYGAVAASGGALGLVLGGVLTRYVAWRWCLYVNVPFALAACAGVAALLDAPPRAQARSSAWRTLLTLLRSSDRRVTSAVAALAVAAMSGAFLLLTYYHQRVRGLSALQTGLAFLPTSIGGMLGSSLIARRLLPRLAPRVLITSALGAGALGLLLLAGVDADSSYVWHLAPAELLLGAGIGAALMPIFSLATLGVEARDAGLASALIMAAQQFGGAVGATLLSAVASSVAHASGAAPRLVDGYRAAAVAGAACLVGAALCAWRLPRRVLGAAH